MDGKPSGIPEGDLCERQVKFIGIKCKIMRLAVWAYMPVLAYLVEERLTKGQEWVSFPKDELLELGDLKTHESKLDAEAYCENIKRSAGVHDYLPIDQVYKAMYDAVLDENLKIERYEGIIELSQMVSARAKRLELQKEKEIDQIPIKVQVKNKSQLTNESPHKRKQTRRRSPR